MVLLNKSIDKKYTVKKFRLNYVNYGIVLGKIYNNEKSRKNYVLKDCVDLIELKVSLLLICIALLFSINISYFVNIKSN